MKMVNDLIKVPQLNKTMRDMSREMMKAGMIDEIMDDALDSAMDTEDLEEETEAELDKVQPPLLSPITGQQKMGTRTLKQAYMHIQLPKIIAVELDLSTCIISDPALSLKSDGL